MLSEGHQRFTLPLLGLVSALIGFSAMLLGGFSRFGLWPQISFAIVLLIAIKAIDTAALDFAIRSANLWWAAYISVVLGLAISFTLLWVSANPQVFKRFRRRKN